MKYPDLRFVTGNWNWTGKTYAILGSVLFLLEYRKFKREDYFLTWKQNSKFKNTGLKVVLALFIFRAITSIFFTPKEWDIETIIFQLTMPGIEEEIAFRGIMLGLLTQVLQDEIRLVGIGLGKPAIWVTSILFGLVHGLFLSPSYEMSFHFYAFINAMLFGFIFAWLTLKSGSILLALVSHNLVNTTSTLVKMIK